MTDEELADLEQKAKNLEAEAAWIRRRIAEARGEKHPSWRENPKLEMRRYGETYIVDDFEQVVREIKLEKVPFNVRVPTPGGAESVKTLFYYRGIHNGYEFKVRGEAGRWIAECPALNARPHRQRTRELALKRIIFEIDARETVATPANQC